MVRFSEHRENAVGESVWMTAKGFSLRSSEWERESSILRVRALQRQ